MSRTSHGDILNQLNKKLDLYLGNYQFNLIDTIFGLPGIKGKQRATRIKAYIKDLDLTTQDGQTKLYSAISAIAASDSKILKNWTIDLVKPEQADFGLTQTLLQRFDGKTDTSKKITPNFSFFKSFLSFFDNAISTKDKTQKKTDIKLKVMGLKK